MYIEGAIRLDSKILLVVVGAISGYILWPQGEPDS